VLGASCPAVRPPPERHDILELHLSTAERSAHLAWPEADFRPDDTDLDRIRAHADRARGSLDLTLLLGRTALFRALEQILAAAGEPDHRAADRKVVAVRHLEEARWHLETTLAVAPDADPIETYAVRVGVLHHHVLSTAGLLASAARSGLRTIALPLVVEVMGREAFVDFGRRVLATWVNSWVKADPRVLIERVAEQTEDDPDPELDAVLLIAAIRPNPGNFDLGAAMLQRALDRVNPPIRLDDGEELAAEDLAREFLAEAEDEFADLDDDTDDLDLEGIANDLYRMRSLLLDRRPGEESDQVGAAFWAALGGASRLKAERHRRSIDPRRLDERSTALVRAIDRLLQ
jgi:hypothetical protein